MFKNEETLTTMGTITFVVIIVGILFLIMAGGKKKNNNKPNVKALTISALLIAVAMVTSQIKLFEMPQGGSVTLLSMLPIALCAYMLGPREGVMAGIALGLINLITGPYVIHPLQLLVDYPLAFGAMGVGGFFRNKKHGLIIGYIVGVIGRYICAVFSGIVFFGSYAPEGFNAVTWSVWYNITYIGVEAIITVAILFATEKTFARLRRQVVDSDAA